MFKVLVKVQNQTSCFLFYLWVKLVELLVRQRSGSISGRDSVEGSREAWSVSILWMLLLWLATINHPLWPPPSSGFMGGSERFKPRSSAQWYFIFNSGSLFVSQFFLSLEKRAEEKDSPPSLNTWSVLVATELRSPIWFERMEVWVQPRIPSARSLAFLPSLLLFNFPFLVPGEVDAGSRQGSAHSTEQLKLKISPVYAKGNGILRVIMEDCNIFSPHITLNPPWSTLKEQGSVFLCMFHDSFLFFFVWATVKNRFNLFN